MHVHQGLGNAFALCYCASVGKNVCTWSF